MFKSEGVRRYFYCQECGEGWEKKSDALYCCNNYWKKTEANHPEQAFYILYVCEICDHGHHTRDKAWECCDKKHPAMPAHVAHVWAEKAGQMMIPDLDNECRC